MPGSLKPRVRIFQNQDSKYMSVEGEFTLKRAVEILSWEELLEEKSPCTWERQKLWGPSPPITDSVSPDVATSAETESQIGGTALPPILRKEVHWLSSPSVMCGGVVSSCYRTSFIAVWASKGMIQPSAELSPFCWTKILFLYISGGGVYSSGSWVTRYCECTYQSLGSSH